MKTNYLFPNSYKRFGWFILIPSVLVGLVVIIFSVDDLSIFDGKFFAIIDSALFKETSYFRLVETNVLDEILSILIIISSLVVAFSKTKNEDEYITKIRLESLVWAIYVNYSILLLCIIFLFNFAFLYALVLNMFTVLLCFIARFHWKLSKMPRGNNYEK